MTGIFSSSRAVEGSLPRVQSQIIELALGFWAARYYGRSAILLVAWVSAFTLIRGGRRRVRRSERTRSGALLKSIADGEIAAVEGV
jgi:hypothetical protein